MRWEPAACEKGDIVRIRLGGLYHYGIFVSEDEVIQFGLPPTAENRASEGEVKVLSTDIDVFACGCIVETAVLDKSEQKRRLPPEETVRLARSRLGESGYNIIHNNCEHFVNACVFGEARCSQADEVRQRWLNRPICDVYLARSPLSGEIISANDEKDFAEKLIYLALKRSFGISCCDPSLKRKRRGVWVCGKVRIFVASYGGITAAAVSNGAVELCLDSKPRKGFSSYTFKEQGVTVGLKGKNCGAVKFFRVENGSSYLMGANLFEREETP